MHHAWITEESMLNVCWNTSKEMTTWKPYMQRWDNTIFGLVSQKEREGADSIHLAQNRVQ
jgi:hypothetical protein